MSDRRRAWTLGIVSVALFMVVLDNLVVSVALPTIHRDLGASIQSLEWTVNAYVLAYAVLLLTGAALGDRFGRKRMFMVGLALFTAASARGRARADDRAAGRRARRSGGRRRDRHAAHAHAARGGLPRRAARHGDRRVVGRSAGSPSRSGRSSAARSCRASPGTGSSGSTCRSAWCSSPLAGAPCCARAAGRRRARSARPRARAHRGVRRHLRARSRAVARLGQRHRARRAGRGGRAARARSCAWERRAARADAADAVLRAALVRGHQRRVAVACTSGCSARSSSSPSTCRTCSATRPLQAGLKLLVWTGATMLVAPLAGVFSERFGSRPFMFAGLALQAGALGVARDARRAPTDLLAHDRPVRHGRRGHGARVRALGERGARRRCAPSRPGRPPVPTTRSGSSAACSASRCSRRCSRRRRLRLAAGFVAGLVPALWVGAGGARRRCARRARASVRHARASRMRRGAERRRGDSVARALATRSAARVELG